MFENFLKILLHNIGEMIVGLDFALVSKDKTH